MHGRELRVLGLLLIVAGALIVAGPTFGFSTIGADRGVSVTSAEDENALFVLVDIYDTSVEIENTGGSGETTADAVEMTNNFNEDIGTIMAAVSSIADEDVTADVLEVANPGLLAGGIDNQDSIDLVLGCSGDAVGSSENTDVTVTIIKADGDTIDVSEKPFVVEDVEFDCEEDDGDDDTSDPATDPTPIDQTEFTISDVVESEEGVIEFVFTNGKDESITVTEFEIRSTSRDDDVVEVTRGRSEIEFGNSGHDEGGQNDGISPGSGPRTLDDGDGETVGSQDNVDVEIANFVDSDDTGNQPEVQMAGQTVTIVLYFDDDGLNPVEANLDVEEE